MLLGEICDTGDRIMALKENAEEIKNLSKREKINCPECGSLLIFKNGKKDYAFCT